jgi:hypothetical protein
VGLRPPLVWYRFAAPQNMPARMSKHNGSLREEPAKIFVKAVRKVEPLIVTQQFFQDYGLLVGICHYNTPDRPSWVNWLYHF